MDMLRLPPRTQVPLTRAGATHWLALPVIGVVAVLAVLAALVWCVVGALMAIAGWWLWRRDDRRAVDWLITDSLR